MQPDYRHPADAVFEGGGVKGIALLGALSVMEQTWQWRNVAGTSAGAVVAAFTAAGMSAHQVREVLDKIELSELMDEGWEEKVDRVVSRVLFLRHIPKVGKLLEHALSIVKDYGIYEGDRFMQVIDDNLPDGVRTFGDLLYDPDLPRDSPYRYKLRVVASDITANRMLVLPQDIRYFGRDPDDLPIAEALRMSISIPVFFEPWKLRDARGVTHHIVDGGILSNYPIWLFDSPPGVDPLWPTFGFDLFNPAGKADGHLPFPQDVKEIKNVLDAGMSIWETLFSAMDRRYIARRHWARTIAIDSCGIPATKFALSSQEKDRLWDAGVEAARKFMAGWGDPQDGFRRWKAGYRGQVEHAQRVAADRFRP
ncbi:MAG: patatin-like phospholipase family protein [Chloroflexi bacterium]|nr:patatin-like phospholipase family protein [Chloroflexota bacterium]